MSRSQYTYQTITTLNVSQDYESPEFSPPPPPPEQQAPQGVPRQDTELVEDSLNANAVTIANDTQIVEDSVENRGAVAFTGQVNRLSQQASEDYDELYSLTPNRPRSQKHSNTAQQPELQRKRSNNPLDALLSRGATVHKAVRTPAGTKRSAPVDQGGLLSSYAWSHSDWKQTPKTSCEDLRASEVRRLERPSPSQQGGSAVPSKAFHSLLQKVRFNSLCENNANVITK